MSDNEKKYLWPSEQLALERQYSNEAVHSGDPAYFLVAEANRFVLFFVCFLFQRHSSPHAPNEFRGGFRQGIVSVWNDQPDEKQ